MKKKFSSAELKREIRKNADPAKAVVLRGFFKTGPGQYGEGDRFFGVTIPVLRRLTKRYPFMPLTEISKLLRSPFHEDRMAALMLLVARFRKGPEKSRAEVYRFYERHLRFVNNWDLVDLSAPSIPGPYWLEQGKIEVMKKMAVSENLWRRRVAMVGSFAFIRAGRFREPLALAAMLRDDPHDLMHKAVGWMLRETGKRDPGILTRFLDEHAALMPRTMLRYAIEKFPETQRQSYLKRKRPKNDPPAAFF